MLLKIVLLIIVCKTSFLQAKESAHYLDWSELIFIPSAPVSSSDTSEKIESRTEALTIFTSVPEWLLSVNIGLLVLPPVKKFKMQYPVGFSFTNINGLDFSFMAVFPARLRASFGYLFNFKDPRFSTINGAFYTGLVVQSTGGDFFASLFGLKNYTPSIGIRGIFRKQKSFSGFFIDNRYEFLFDGSGYLRVLLTVSYFVPL